MKAFRVIAGVVLGVFMSGAVFAGTAGDNPGARLMDGNKRFVEGKLATKDIGDNRRNELSKGQHPFAIVLTCSDSRVAPELLFDQGLGDVFVIRVAGNVVDDITLGSIEYAAEHLHAPLLLILGHQSCGAVKAALGATGEPEGNIGAILKKIMPAAEKAKAAGRKDEAETLDMAVQENIKDVYADVMAKSPVIKELAEGGKLKVMMGEYYLDSGRVKVMEAAEEKQNAKE